MRWLLRGPLPAAPQVAVTELRAADARPPHPPRTRSCSRHRGPEPPAARRTARAGARDSPAPRALAVSRLPTAGLGGLPPLLIPVLPGEGRCACPSGSAVGSRRTLPSRARRVLRGTLVHQLLEAARLRAAGRPPEAAQEVAALIEAHGVTPRSRKGAELARRGERFVGRSCSNRSPAGRSASHRAAIRVHARAPWGGERGLLVNGVVDVHASEADGAVVTTRATRSRTRPAGADRRRFHPAARVRLAGPLRGQTGGGRALLPRAAPAPPPRRQTDAAGRASCSARGDGVVQGASSLGGRRALRHCPRRAALCSWDEQPLREP